MGAKIIWSKYMNIHAGYRKAQNGSPGISNSYWRVAIATRQTGHTWGMNAGSHQPQGQKQCQPASSQSLAAWGTGDRQYGCVYQEGKWINLSYKSNTQAYSKY